MKKPILRKSAGNGPGSPASARSAVSRRGKGEPPRFTKSNGNGGGPEGLTGSQIVDNAKPGPKTPESGRLNTMWRTRARQMRHNPIRGLSAESLARALDAFDYGDIRQAALLWEQMAKRDDMIPTVKGKRERAVVRRGWKVLRLDQSAEAEAHAAALEYFWDHCTGMNAYDRNERGGVRVVLTQMMQAVTFKYAAQHIIWKPQGEMLTAEFEFVPLSFFENRTGMLRFTPTGTEAEGEPLAPNDWLVTAGEGLMFPACIVYYGKRCSMQDWEAFCEKFGLPGVLGKTRAAKGSPEWDSLGEAVAGFMNDWGAVCGQDDTIELIQTQATGSMLPMAVKVERADRMIAALWRGADLSTLSSQTGADSTGAGLQEDEAHGMAMDDAAMVSEAMQEIDRRVIAWHFGRGIEPMAYTIVPCPERKDLQVRLAAIEKLLPMGLPIAMDEIREDFGFQTPADGDELLEAPEPPPVVAPPEGGKKGAENSYDPNQPRDPKGSKTGGRWTSASGSDVDITYLGREAAQIEEHLETRKTKYVAGEMERVSISERTTDEGEEVYRVYRAGGDWEDVATKNEAEAIVAQEKKWFESASIQVDGEGGEALLVDDNGDVVELWRRGDDGSWEERNTGSRLEVDDLGGGEMASAIQERADVLLRGMPLASATVHAEADGFRFRAKTGGSEPYEILGVVKGDVLKIDSMLPVDGKQSFSGSSRGAGLLIATVEAAKDGGLKAIETTGGKSADMTGYRTWPALGFEWAGGGLEKISDAIPSDMISLAGDPPSLLRLTSTKEGRRWWRRNGKSVGLRFDLAAGSASNQRLNQVKEMLAK